MKQLFTILMAVAFASASLVAEAAPRHAKRTTTHATQVKKAKVVKMHSVKKSAGAKKTGVKPVRAHKHR